MKKDVAMTLIDAALILMAILILGYAFFGKQ